MTATTQQPALQPTVIPVPARPSRRERWGYLYSVDNIIGYITAIVGLAVLLFAFHWSYTSSQHMDAPYLSQAPRIEQLLNVKYVEDITYTRARESHGRYEASTLEEHLYVDGTERHDCALAVTNNADGQPATAALTCSLKPLTEQN